MADQVLRLDDLDIPDVLKEQLQGLYNEDPKIFSKVNNHIITFIKSSENWSKEKVQSELDNIREDDLVKKDVFKRVKRAVLLQKLKDVLKDKPCPKDKPASKDKFAAKAKSASKDKLAAKDKPAPKDVSPPTKKSRKSISIISQAKSSRRKSVAPAVNPNKRKRSPTPTTSSDMEVQSSSANANEVDLPKGDVNEISQYMIFSREFLDSSTVTEIVHHSANASILAVTQFHQLHYAQQYVNSPMLRSSFAVSNSDELMAVRNTLYRKGISHITYEKSTDSPKIDIVVTAPNNTSHLNKCLKNTVLYLPKFPSDK